MIQMTLARIAKVLEFTAMITQTSWLQNVVIDTLRNEDMKDIFILVIHFQISQLFKSATMWIYCRRTPSLDEL